LLHDLRQAHAHDALAGTELAVVIPTFNEAANIGPLLEGLEAALEGVNWEAVFVDDDSPDGTSELLTKVCRSNPRVRSLRRIGRRGLASAVCEGILSTSTPYVAVIDGDMQHDERLLPQMLEVLRKGDADLVVGSRYTGNGSVEGWDAKRQRMSRIASTLARVAVKAELTDPMSGFFMIRRPEFDAAVRNLSAQGYKVLLDIIASSPTPLRIAELPYVFRVRERGESKLDALVVVEYVSLLVDKLVGHWVPIRFVVFSAVGALGIAVHMTVLAMLLRLWGASYFTAAQAGATLLAMTFNFFLNNTLTYRDRRLKGLGPILRGWLIFCAVCSVGALANVGVANFVFYNDYSWWLAGLSGVLISAAWNYGATSILTWRK
jgi:dolichol-phosphate mannosyltransferase